MIRWTPPGGPCVIVVVAMSHLSLLTLVVALVDVTAGIATAPVLVEVGT
jgi:hypothetical protein